MDTFPKLLREKALRWGASKVAIREKDYGLWHDVTWEAYWEQVKAFGLGLKVLGLNRGDHVSVIGNNEPEWVYAELAVQALGGVVVGIYQDSTPPEVQYGVAKSDSVFVIAEDQEQVDKLLEIQEEIPQVKQVVYWDPKGMRHYEDELLIGFEAVQALGRDFERSHPKVFDREVDVGVADDVAVILPTSGTTSAPKLAMLSFGNMLQVAENLLVKVDPMVPTDKFVSALPLAWVGEQMMAVSGAMHIGFTVHFPEEATTVQENIREIAPQVMFSPPRVWEDLVSTIQVKMEDSSRLKKWVYQMWMRKVDGGSGERALFSWVGDWMLFRTLRDRIGLSQIRNAYTGGAALGPDVFRFFHAMGVNLKQIYGQTEISGISVIHRSGDVKFETVGHPIPETEVRISPEGEILSRSPSVFRGYYQDPEATEKALKNGWLHSGDAGYMDADGHLVVIDRMSDVMQLLDGETFSPQSIENQLKFSPYIKEAVVFGQERPYVAAFINIDFENVGKWAENRQIAYTSYTDLSQKPEVYALIQEGVAQVNEGLPEGARIVRFVNLHKELDADDQELTRTRKVRRGFVEKKYGDLVEALYGEVEEVLVEAQVRYRDGREVLVETGVRVERVGE
ncbi:MAG: AMP-binding protein [bacterium]|nr:AMP-binding protein [bacterium]